MNYLVCLAHWFLSLVVVALFACCQSEKPQPSTTDAPQEMERLLLAADTLSAEALTAEVRKLPGTWVDTFFHARQVDLLKNKMALR